VIIKDSFIRDCGRLFVWYPFRWLMQILPIPLVIRVGQIMGRLESIYSKKRLTIMAENIRRALGVDNEEASAIARRNLELHYIHLLEVFKFPYYTKENIERYIEYRGLNYLDASLKKGKGVILIHLHFGTMQMPLVALGVKGYRMNQIGRREPENENLSWIHRKVTMQNRLKIEKSIPANIINVETNKSLRPAFRCLQQNEILMITGDGHGGTNPIGDNYILVDFLGQKTYFPRGPVIIAQRTGAVMLPLFCFRLDDVRQCADIHPPLPLNFSNDKEADIRNNTQLYADALSKGLREHPDHWMFWQEFSPGQMICPEDKAALTTHTTMV